MMPLCLEWGDITQEQLELFWEVSAFVDVITGPDCHSICAQVAENYGDRLMHYKGKFNGADHSWLVFREDPDVIIDAYPWAVASGPILLTMVGILNPQRSLYQGEEA